MWGLSRNSSAPFNASFSELWSTLVSCTSLLCRKFPVSAWVPGASTCCLRGITGLGKQNGCGDSEPQATPRSLPHCATKGGSACELPGTRKYRRARNPRLRPSDIWPPQLLLRVHLGGHPHRRTCCHGFLAGREAIGSTRGGGGVCSENKQKQLQPTRLVGSDTSQPQC